MKSKRGTVAFRPNLVSFAVASCFAASTALANPTNPTVVHGAANFANPAANVLNVTTATSKTIINWGSFSINANELTKFLQPSAASAVLNRVAAGNPSQILGALQSNGRVFIVNPSGITFGAGSQVDVAGLIATSLNLSNSDFLADRLKFTDGASAGSVINQGNITTGSGGEIYLVGNAVTNNGIITSPNGTVVLAAGNSVELVNPGTPNLRVEIVAPENEARNLGQIVVNSGRAGIYAGLINNSGTIRADSVVAEGGKIMLKATKSVTLESSSILSASGAGGGTIEVLAKDGGTVNVNGRLDASAPVSGDGGFIETSADIVKVAPGTVVTTTAVNGKAGVYLIDPTNDYTIAYGGGDIDGLTVNSILATSNFSINSNQGAYGGNGDIFVNDSIFWTNPATSLTLTAMRHVEINSSITNSSSGGGLNVYAGWNGSGDPTAPAISSIQSNVGWIYLPATVTMGQASGRVVLVAGNVIDQHTGSGNWPITANELVAYSVGNSVLLNNSNNSVNMVAGRATNSFNFNNNRTLTVGSIDTGNPNVGVSGVVDGIQVASPFNAMVNLVLAGTTPGGSDLNVNSNISVTGGPSASGGTTIQLFNNSIYGGNINVNSSALSATADGGEGAGITVMAAYGGSISVNNSSLNAISNGIVCCGITTSSSISLSATGVSIGSSMLKAAAGAGSSSYGGSVGTINVNSGSGGVLIGASTLEAVGGANSLNGGGTGSLSVSSSSGGASIGGSVLRAKGGNGVTGGGQGQVSVSSGTGTLNFTGGSLVEALGGAGATGGGASANLVSNSPSTINITDSAVHAIAANGSTFGGSGSVSITDGSSNINITNSQIQAEGNSGTIYISAVGNTTISNSSLTVNGLSGPVGSEATIDIFGNAVTINNSSVTANGGSGTAGIGGDASIVSYAGTGGLHIAGSTIQAFGGPGTTSPGYGLVELESGLSGGPISISNSTIQAAGQGGAVEIFSDLSTVSLINSTISANSVNGASGDAGIFQIIAAGSIDTSGSSISAVGGPGSLVVIDSTGGPISISNSTIQSSGQGAGAFIFSDLSTVSLINSTISVNGDASTVVISASGSIDTSGSSISAVGPGSFAGIESAGGDVTLGLLSSEDVVSVSAAGRIIDGNPAGNAVAPFVAFQAGLGVGTIADPLETATTNLFAATSGGEIGIINQGNLILSGLGNSGAGASAVGTTGTMVFNSDINVLGNLSLLANNGMVVEKNISSGGDLLISSGIGDLGFNGVTVLGNNVTLSGNNIFVGFSTSTLPTLVQATNLMTAVTAGNLNVIGGSDPLATSTLGGLDVDLTVGTTSGFVNIVTGSGGASAQIAAGSPLTITLLFPTLTAGGFFVNGNEGVISDGDTGFFANGLPAVPGGSFQVTYGGTTPPAGLPAGAQSGVEQAINQVVVATNEQTTTLTETNTSGDDANNAGTGGTTEEKQKKALPICGK